MTRVDFYTSAADKLQTACRLSAKAYGRGLRVTILTPDPETSRRLDEMLWRDAGFLPHCLAEDPLAAETPIVIDDKGENHFHDDVLFNLRLETPAAFSRFSRLVEIVGESEADVTAGRTRFRFYRDRGYETHHHNLKGGDAA